MCIPGEPWAGHEWDNYFVNMRLKMGWRKADGVPGLLTFKDLFMLYEVDDFLIGEPLANQFHYTARTIMIIENEIGEKLKWEAEPTVYAGVRIARSLDRKRLSMDVRQKVVEAARDLIPDVLDKKPGAAKAYGILQGAKLQRGLDELHLDPIEDGASAATYKMSKEQKQYQMGVGKLRYICERMPRLQLHVAKLSKVAARPMVPHAMVCLRSVAAMALEANADSITYDREATAPRPQMALKGEMRYVDDGKDMGHGSSSGVTLEAGAPCQTEGHADATWNRFNDVYDTDGNLTTDAIRMLREAPDDYYGILVTRAGAAVAAKCATLKLVTSASMFAEEHATTKVLNVTQFVDAIEQALGQGGQGPTLITTDNKANQLVGSGQSGAARSRHHLRKYLEIQQAVALGNVILRHVPDAENPADFLTKWLSKEKVDVSIEYATRLSRAVKESPKELLDEAHRWMVAALAKAAKDDELLAVAKADPTARLVTLDSGY